MGSGVRRHLAAVVMLAAVAVVTAAAWWVRLPVFVVEPGPVLPVAQVVHVAGVRDEPEDPDDAGGVWLTAITAQPAALVDLLVAGLDPARDVVPRSQVIPPGQDDEEFLAVNRRLMKESQLIAAFAAYRLAGSPAILTAAGAEVLLVAAGSSAARAGLRPGDVITAVDGRPVVFAGDLAAAAAAAGGRGLDLTVVRAGRRLHMILVPGDATSLQELGLTAVSHDLQGTFDPEVQFRTGAVAGPSAGLAFGLFLVDRLVPGALAAGGPVAATGVLAVDGTVGPVGGVRYKARAAARAGARVFVVPAANADEARSAAPQLQVVGVASLAEAVDGLASMPLTPILAHPYNDAGLEAIPVAN